MKVSPVHYVALCALALVAVLAVACINPQPLPPGFHDVVLPAKGQRLVLPRAADAGTCGSDASAAPRTNPSVR